MTQDVIGMVTSYTLEQLASMADEDIDKLIKEEKQKAKDYAYRANRSQIIIKMLKGLKEAQVIDASFQVKEPPIVFTQEAAHDYLRELIKEAIDKDAKTVRLTHSLTSGNIFIASYWINKETITEAPVTGISPYHLIQEVKRQSKPEYNSHTNDWEGGMVMFNRDIRVKSTQDGNTLCINFYLKGGIPH